MNIPNSLTLLRIFLIPVFVIIFYLPFEWNHIAGAAIFSIAAITDALDGYLARKLNQISSLGTIIILEWYMGGRGFYNMVHPKYLALIMNFH